MPAAPPAPPPPVPGPSFGQRGGRGPARRRRHSGSSVAPPRGGTAGRQRSAGIATPRRPSSPRARPPRRHSPLLEAGGGTRGALPGAAPSQVRAQLSARRRRRRKPPDPGPALTRRRLALPCGGLMPRGCAQCPRRDPGRPSSGGQQCAAPTGRRDGAGREREGGREGWRRGPGGLPAGGACAAHRPPARLPRREAAPTGLPSGRGCSWHLAPPGCAWAALPVAFSARGWGCAHAQPEERWLWFFRAEDFSFSLVILCDLVSGFGKGAVAEDTSAASGPQQAVESRLKSQI